MEGMEDTRSAALVPVPADGTALSSHASVQLAEAFLSGRNERTRRAYGQDLEDFRRFTGSPSADEALRELLTNGHGVANALALAYRAHLVERGLAAATVNRRLSALRSAVELAGTLGLVPWALKVPSLKAEKYRDTRGPGRSGFARLLDGLEDRDDEKAVRDRALVRLLYDLALRRGEAVSLDVEDVDLEAGTVAVLGKGRTGRELLTLPEPTKAALAAWLVVRGTKSGPVFVALDRANRGSRLTGRGVHAVLRALGERVGVKVRPHGLRHAAITEALGLTNGNVRAVQRYSRHRDLRVLMVYDDNREDLGGEVARLVAGGGEE